MADDCNIIGRHILGDALVFGDAWVSGDARVSGNALVSGNAWVAGNARVSGDAVVLGGIIDCTARIESSADLIQLVVDGVVWSRFLQADGSSRTTCTVEDATLPGWGHAAFDAWEEARRG